MKKFLIAAIVAGGMAISPAGAVLLDFANYADTNGEGGIDTGDIVNINGVNVQFVAELAQYHPYFDASLAGKRGGLGVCKILDLDNQCDPGSDDNVTITERVELDLVDYGVFSVTSLEFRDADHNLLGLPIRDGLVTIYTGADQATALANPMTLLFSQFIAMASGGDSFFKSIGYIAFEYVNTEFYVTAVGVDVPVPGALPLLLSGLAGLGFAARRRRKKTA